MATHSRKLPADPNLALRIQLRMRRKGLTVTALATTLGLTKGAVSHWINGRFEPPRAMIPRLAEALGVSVEALMGTKLTDDQKAQELALMRLLLGSPPELQELLEELGPERALAVLRRESARRPKKR